jgi:hypothetical protein
MRTSLFLAAAAFFATAASADGSHRERQHHRFDTRVAIGFRISPVQLDLRGKNPAMVGLGSYVVNAAGACNDCHTHPSYAPGGDPFQGQPEMINTELFLSGGRQFGPIVAPNITPDENGRPGGYTADEFLALMRTGHDPRSPERILQIMPWNVYGKMSRVDLLAMYEYLRAIPALPDNPAPGP